MDELEQEISESLHELEPQVTSSDPNERKLARRLRIERRLEAIRRQNLPEEEQDDEEGKYKSLTQTQIEKSVEVLKKLLAEGEVRVTNIKVANDSRETDRREAEGVNRQNILSSLEEEAHLAEEAFNQIADKWLGILKSNDPLHINDRMMQQKEKCDELISQKDGLIAMLKEEILTQEKKFGEDQKKQIDDVCLLSDRIDKQIALTRRVYREQLNLIEESMLIERKSTMDTNDKKWEDFHKARDREEQSNSDKKYQQLEYFDKQMMAMRRDFQEKYRQTKIELEHDIDDLQKELERIKALALLNSEKLEYNYQILKKREDENIIIKSQQKRRINKLQDVVNTLKRKITAYGGDTKVQMVKVSNEVAKLQKNILDIESKADHFAVVNDMKFNQLWDMNTERALHVADRILKIDRILHEQLLGLEVCEKGLLKRKELKKENLVSYREAVEILEAEAQSLEPQKTLELKESRPVIMDAKKEAVQLSLLKRLLKQIADKAGFIMEDRLQQILEPFYDDQKTLIRMDNVFSALNITKEADIDELLKYFLPYTHCPVCAGNIQEKESSAELSESEVQVHQISDSISKASKGSQLKEDQREKEGKEVVIPPIHLPVGVISNIVGEVADPETAKSDSSSSVDEEVLVVYETLDPLETVIHLGGSTHKEDLVRNVEVTESLEDARMSCQYYHPLVISPVYIIKALRHFVNNYYTQKAGLPTMGYRLTRKRNTICRLVKESDIKYYWEQFRNIFSEENESVWNAISAGLQKYHEILKDRHDLNIEVMGLRRENEDLKILLAKYIEDPTNPNMDAPQRDIPPGLRAKKK